MQKPKQTPNNAVVTKKPAVLKKNIVKHTDQEIEEEESNDSFVEDDDGDEATNDPEVANFLKHLRTKKNDSALMIMKMM